MKMLQTGLRTVPDTNVLLAAEMSVGPTSPNVEYFDRWESGEFAVLFSHDTFLEYALKLREKNIPGERIKQVLRALLELGIEVFIEYYHLHVYPIDTDDIAFLVGAGKIVRRGGPPCPPVSAVTEIVPPRQDRRDTTTRTRSGSSTISALSWATKPHRKEPLTSD